MKDWLTASPTNMKTATGCALSVVLVLGTLALEWSGHHPNEVVLVELLAFVASILGIAYMSFRRDTSLAKTLDVPSRSAQDGAGPPYGAAEGSSGLEGVQGLKSPPARSSSVPGTSYVPAGAVRESIERSQRELRDMNVGRDYEDVPWHGGNPIPEREPEPSTWNPATYQKDSD
jgi:hypothetical protein